MYRINLVIAIRDPKQQKSSRKKKITAAIGVMKLFEELDTQIMGPKIAAEVGKEGSDEVIPSECVWMTDLPIPKIFYELRKKFNSGNINTNAEVSISVGTMNHDIIVERLSREEYMSTPDEQLIRYFISRIKYEPKLKHLYK